MSYKKEFLHFNFGDPNTDQTSIMSISSTSAALLQKIKQSYKKKTGHDIGPPMCYEPGKVIFRENEIPKGIFFINYGMVKIQKEEGDHLKSPIVRVSKGSDFIGVESLIAKTIYKNTATVIEKAEIQFIPKQVFLELLEFDIDFNHSLINLLCEHNQNDEHQIMDLITLDARQRLATLLLSLEYALSEKGGHSGIIHILKKDIASMIGITAETLSRYLSEFEKKNLLSLEDKGIQLKNRSELIKLSSVRD